MFDNNIKTEPTPERVLELCRIASRMSNEKDIRAVFEPKRLNENSTPIFTIIRDVAFELKLLEQDGEKLKFIGSKDCISSFDGFRKYCNSIVWKKSDTNFSKLAAVFLESNDEMLKNKRLTDPAGLAYLTEKTKISLTNNMVLGFRFWFSFLGFGYIQENKTDMYYLPNMVIALTDFIEMMNLKKNKEYTVNDFMANLSILCPVATENALETHQLNLALSNGLRLLDATGGSNGNGLIDLKNNLDSKEKWNLFPSYTHRITSEFSHIIYKGR